jgi:hypothetical protein
VATPTPGGEQLDAVRALQHVLYRAAKGRSRTTMRGLYRRSTAGTSPGGRRPGGRNNGAPGIDRTTLAKVEEYRESVCPITWTWSPGRPFRRLEGAETDDRPLQESALVAERRLRDIYSPGRWRLSGRC